jgi:hypothetical protein
MVEYYEHPGLNQSKLKLLLTNPKLFNVVEEPESFGEDKRHFIIGGAVDCILTAPQDFPHRYHVSDVENKPVEGLRNVILRLYSKIKDYPEIGPIQQYREEILESYLEEDYQSRQLEDTKYSKACEAYEYFDDLVASRGKQVISGEEYSIISQVVMNIRTNDDISTYFSVNVNEELVYQLAIYFEYEGVECKALLDMVKFDHKKKTIQPIDIKTLSDYTMNFPKSLRRRRYDIQAAFYREALQRAYPEYQILPFKFIVESTTDPGNPLVFTCNQFLMHIGKYGRRQGYVKLYPEGSTSYYEQRVEEIKGFHQLIELYKYYTQNGFDKDQVVRENQSHLLIDWSGIIV